MLIDPVMVDLIELKLVASCDNYKFLCKLSNLSQKLEGLIRATYFSLSKLAVSGSHEQASFYVFPPCYDLQQALSRCSNFTLISPRKFLH